MAFTEVLKLAFWGINETILNVIRKEIDPRRARITLFIDSNPEVQGSMYMGVPVVSPDRFSADDVDHVVIGALSAYEKIKQKLVESGCPEKRIHPFVTPQLPEYCLGDITDVNKQLVESIYFEPKPLLDTIMRYEKLYQTYRNIPPRAEDGKEWYQKSDLISHACGGVINGKRFMYTNSKEALEYSFEQNFKLIECDVCGIMTGEPVLAHKYMNIYESMEEGYTLLSLAEIIRRISEHPEVSLLLDIKWTDYEEYEKYITYIEQVINQISLNEDEKTRLKSQIIPEVYDEPTIKIAYAYGYEMALTSYRNPDCRILMNTAILCHKYNIKVVLIGANLLLWNKESGISKFLRILTDKNIKIFCYSTDSIKDYQYLKKIGVKGIFTNYLTYEKVLKIDKTRML